MFKCELCKRQFDNITKLAAHLSHPKSSCKVNIKIYYDKYLRKKNEGICIYCGRETAFSSLSKGYPSIKCKHCRNNDLETKIIRKQNSLQKREKKKQDNGYYQLKVFCEICDERFKTRQGLAKHISQKHIDISLRSYYDKYFKKPKEGICPITGNKTNFKSLVAGYYKYYGIGTNSADDEIKKKKKITLLKNYNVTNSVKANEKKRIDSFKNTFKERRILKEKRNELILILRKLTIDKTNKLQCQYCGRSFINHGFISSHIVKGKDYYNTFFKKENEGICPISKLNTNFDCLERGYFKYHKSILTHIPEIKNASKEAQLNYIKTIILNEQDQYNVEIKDPDSINIIGDLTIFKYTLCSTEYKTRFTYLRSGFGKCQKCFPRNTHKSTGENELFDFIKSIYSKSILTGYTKLIKNPDTNRDLELDIFLPEKKLAIEFDGLYWHSECILNNPVNYHLNKTNSCREKGVNLIHIFEDEWNDKKEIIKKMLLHKLGESNKVKIYARKCYIKEIEPKEKNKFLERNHIQGGDSSKIKLGLFTKDHNNLVSVMTFSGKNLSKGTINIKDTDWELSRFATDINYRVVGAAGKLLEYFKNNFKWTLIFSYADLRWSNGDLYNKIGFNFVHQTSPNYWYVNSQGKRTHRFSLRKRPDEPKDIPEWKLRHQQGYYRIWDCGHLKFEVVKKSHSIF